MIIQNLTDFLDEREKKSVQNVIAGGDKIISSGICQYLKEKNGQWDLENSPGVVIFSKNSSHKIYKILFVEPIVNKLPVTHLEINMRNKNYTIQQPHKNLVVFHYEHHKVIGFNFHDSEEAKNVYSALESIKNKKQEKKFSIRRIFTKKEKEMEIGKPTNFKHIQHVGLDMTEDQQELYNLIKPELKTNGKEEEEIVKRFVVNNESKLRQSMMKEKKKTPKSVKKGFFKSSKQKEAIQEEQEQEKEPTFKTPTDPLHPNWDEDGLAVSQTTTINIKEQQNVSNVVIADCEPITSYDNNNKYYEKEEYSTPRKDSYGIRNQPHTLYRFENEEQETRPPTLPSRSTSRVEKNPLPRLPSHRQSYRWATNPADAPSPSSPSAQNQQAVRVAPPPPVSSPSSSQSLPPIKPPPLAPPPPPPLLQNPIILSPPSKQVESEEDEEAEEVETRKTSTVSNERKSFLEEIQNVDRSKILRKVSEDDQRVSVTSPSGENTMIDAIQQFLDARRTGINPSDSENSDESDDDDWSD